MRQSTMLTPQRPAPMDSRATEELNLKVMTRIDSATEEVRCVRPLLVCRRVSKLNCRSKDQCRNLDADSRISRPCGAL